MMRHTRRIPYLARFVMPILGGLGLTQPAWAGNPGYDRPGYGFTPVVLDAGDIIVEQGLPDWSRDRQDGTSSSLYSADSLLRIGLGGPVELQLGSSPWNALRQTGAGGDTSIQGHGDTVLGLKLALPSSNQAFSWGLLGSVEFTDGAQAFRSERRQYLLGAQFNLQANENNSLGLYLQDVRSGGADSTTVAASDNYALGKTVTLYAEAAWLHVPDQGSGTVAGGGLAWMVTPRVQLDAGFDRRLSGAAPDWQTNLGVSIYFGH
ncbi:transporter [Rhodanobacter sp. B04]|uniref:transporter n=1 Tax=Rhodanobacter sp. B04 TaxID=1945860 RepID=UPI0011159BF1|nr:transporter [Rhodanobacter sp. B04]